MSVEKLPGGTRGTRQPPGFLARLLVPIMIRVHRRSGDRFQGQDLLYLTTTGAKSGQRRTNPVARFDDGGGGWIIVASAGGTAHHPAWYHNIVAHPEQVQAEVAGTTHRVSVEQLDGEARERAWAAVIAASPRFEGYTEKTDRVLPVLRLTAID
ncbi:MAG TPA: nitroreductase/quinone reductase family protein [Kineosporiaceae bacterium]|nr:nitroreductase/quinone reductase family protein [Kineosporiaceae bacterium]